jgi:hypothetical protein
MPFESFQSRLASVMDDVIALLEGDGSYTHFLLDGQMAALDDYLAVRPAAASAVADLGELIQAGRLSCRPLVRADGRVLRVRRDDRPQLCSWAWPGPPTSPAGRTIYGRRVRGGRLPAGHVRPRRARCRRSCGGPASGTPWSGGGCPVLG